ncbi:hypothetical protein [Brucella pituitosa]|uniref:hypothetical protein n=1 Tax=Brucella pituitosa TaxID=571256 RepID=UPI003F4ACF6D
MGLMALQQEFEGFSASLPLAPALVAQPGRDTDDPMSDFNQAMKIYKRQVTIWRSNLIIAIEKLRDIFDRAEELDRQSGQSVLVEYLFEQALPALYSKMDEVEVHAKEKFIEMQQNPALAQLEAISPRHRKLARVIKKKTDEAYNLQVEYLDQIRQKMLGVADEYDPDNKPVGDVLRAGDDFDAWFNRIVAAE